MPPPASPPPPPPSNAHATPIPINSPEPGLKVAALPPGEPQINQLFRTVMLHKGSDLHLKAGLPGMMRLRGVIQKMNTPVLKQETLEKLIFPIMREKDKKVFDETGGADFAHVIGDGEARYRVNVLKQRGQLAMVARLVNQSIPSFEKLFLPPQIEKLCHYEMGMVLLAGVTGSGKSTTIASMLDYINQSEPLHILTLEDPVEFVFTDKMSIVNQREVYLDVCDWHTGLKHAVREDPDIILVGELRDSETFESAVHASETGHVVFGTIHASNAYSTIDRILGLFPPSQHGAVRQSMSFNLRAVVAQKLLPSCIPGVSRVPTNEIMIVNPRIRDIILKGEDAKLLDAIRANYNEGMVDFNENLRQLVELQRIDKTTALEFSPNPEQLRMALKGIKVAASGLV
jgi:twitching motility protein PilT